MATPHVIFLAAENGALRGGKVGGVGDVVRDLPAALVASGWDVTVLTPGYGMFPALPGAEHLGDIEVGFRGGVLDVDVHAVPGGVSTVRNIVFEHPLFSPHGPGHVYNDVDGEGPFATDANKFALFGAAAAQWIADQQNPPTVVHLHDWHAAFYCLLRSFSSQHASLLEIPTVLTIHNLSYQGTRPLDGDESSLAAWFPDLDYDATLVRDPHAHHCINPLALAIRSCDRISTVSPTYAREILRPSDPGHGFIGGEGLEVQLGNAAKAGRLVGILNGCEYDVVKSRRPGWQRIVGLARAQAAAWHERQPDDPSHELALQRLDALPQRRPPHVLVSIGRLVSQKVTLFLAQLEDGRSALEHITASLGSRGVLILLGSGEADLERRVLDVAGRCGRLIFLRGYSETLADPLYRAGDLFLMPSSFEPCGISQMLAMRAAQPCVVHAVGGLCDTVEEGRTGFLFGGDTPAAQAENFVATVERALDLRSNHPNRWQNLCIRAASRRFDWATAAERTIMELYEPAL